MIEEWVKWVPTNRLSGKYYADAIYYDKEGFRLLLIGECPKNKIKIFFKGEVASYRETYESFRLEKIDSLDKAKYDGKWTFFKIINSHYVEWLTQTSLGILTSIHYTHFCFLTDESIIDVIANHDPIIEFID